VLKWFFPLVVVWASFGNVAELFIVIFLKEKVVGYLPNCFPLVFKVIICH
jgi:hypothetical protein